MRAKHHRVAECAGLRALAALRAVDVAHDEEIVHALERRRTLLDVIEIAPEHRVIRIQLVVDARHALAVVVVERHREAHLAAGIAR